MQPHAVPFAHIRDRVDRIDGPHVDRSELRDNAKRHVAPRAILGEHPVERVDVHREVGQARDEPDGVSAEVQHVGDACDRDVPFVVGHVDQEPPASRGVLQPVRRRVVRRDVAQRGEQRREVRHRSARDQDPAGVFRIAHESGDPAHALTLHLGRRRPKVPRPCVRVRRGRERFGQDTDHRPRTVHVCEVARRPERRHERADPLAPVRNEGVDRLGVLGQLTRKLARDEFRCRVGKDPALGKPVVVVRDGVDDVASDAPELVKVDVAGPRPLLFVGHWHLLPHASQVGPGGCQPP